MNKTIVLILVAVVGFYIGQNFPGILPRLPLPVS